MYNIPCHCGKDAATIMTTIDGSMVYAVQCPHCFRMTDYHARREDAEKQWKETE